MFKLGLLVLILVIKNVVNLSKELYVVNNFSFQFRTMLDLQEKVYVGL